MNSISLSRTKKNQFSFLLCSFPLMLAFFFMENHYKTFFIFILFLLCVCKFCYITVVLDLRLFMTINLYSTVFVLLFVSNVPGLWNIFKTFVMIENLLFLCLFVLYSCSNVPAMFPDYEGVCDSQQMVSISHKRTKSTFWLSKTGINWIPSIGLLIFHTLFYSL